MNSSGRGFSNTTRNLRQLSRSPVSWGVALALLAIHAAVISADTAGIYQRWGLNRESFLSGQVWRIFSHGFLHGSWLHVFLNSLFLLLVGFRIEHMVGRLALLKVMAGGVLGGGIGHVLLAPGGADAPMLVGSSGACLALLLLLTTLSPQSRMLPLPVSGKSLGLGILLAEMFLALIHPGVGIPGFSNVGRAIVDHGLGAWFQVGHACHLGGGITGWLAGRWILRPRISLKQLRQDRARREERASRRADP